jgi:hypothetical protein
MRKLSLLLAVAFGPSLVAVFYALLIQSHTAAFNSHANEYRKWPWGFGMYKYDMWLDKA